MQKSVILLTMNLKNSHYYDILITMSKKAARFSQNSQIMEQNFPAKKCEALFSHIRALNGVHSTPLDGLHILPPPLFFAIK